MRVRGHLKVRRVSEAALALYRKAHKEELFDEVKVMYPGVPRALRQQRHEEAMRRRQAQAARKRAVAKAQGVAAAAESSSSSSSSSAESSS